MANEPFVTLIADGSWSSESRKGGWAARLIYEGERFTYSGPCKNLCKQSYDAEIAAIGNGLKFALEEKVIPEFKGIFVQTDNMRTLELLKTLRENRIIRSAMEIKVRLFLCQLLDEKKVKYFSCRHIKGHVPEHQRQARHHVHEVLDRLAKQGRRLAEKDQTNVSSYPTSFGD